LIYTEVLKGVDGGASVAGVTFESSWTNWTLGLTKSSTIPTRLSVHATREAFHAGLVCSVWPSRISCSQRDQRRKKAMSTPDQATS